MKVCSLHIHTNAANTYSTSLPLVSEDEVKEQAHNSEDNPSSDVNVEQNHER